MTTSGHDDEPGARPAGWYPDPAGTGQLWSDGRPTSEQGPAAPAVPARVIKNTVATVGLAIGAVGVGLAFVWGPWVSLVAVICSVAALPQAQTLASHGYAPVGRARAIGGVALGVLGVVVTIAVRAAAS
jgi:1,4-dihydroxy-2-naphthoate octaprenyltransferase